MDMDTPLVAHELSSPVLQRQFFWNTHGKRSYHLFTSALFHQSFQGTRADHMRARKVAAITARARKRPNWNLFASVQLQSS